MMETKASTEINNTPKYDFKVFQAAKWYWPEIGGIETVAKAITEAVSDKAEIEILVCSENKKREEGVTEEGAHIYRAKTPCKLCSMPLSADYLRAFSKMSKDADIIQLHAPFPLSDLALFLCGGRKKKKKVLWYHSDVVKQKKMLFFYKPLMKWMLKRMDAIYVAGNSIVEQSKYLAPYKDKVKVIPFGISVDYYENAVKKPVLTEKLKNSNSTKILFVGRLVYYKGVEVLISAMEKVKNAELFIIGSGELEDELKMQAVKLGLQDEVHFMGRVDTETLLSAFSDCDVFVLPSISRAECFGLVQLEAMVYGKPVINTALPTAVPEVSLDGVTGITVKPEDADELAGAIQKLSDDKDLRERYGAEAEKRCKEKFSLQQMEDSLFASYLELLGK